MYIKNTNKTLKYICCTQNCYFVLYFWKIINVDNKEVSITQKWD